MNRIPVAATVVLLLGSSACGADDEEPAGASTLSVAVDQDPGSLDPQNTVLSIDSQFASFAYDTLVYVAVDGSLVSGLAESWEESGTTYTFTLRDDVTCSDGPRLTAADIADNFTYLADPESQSPLLGLYIPPGLIAEADDAAGQLTLTLAESFPFFLTGLTGVPIVCPEALEDRDLLAQETHGTGPYELTDAVPGSSYTYSLREDYSWGPDGAAAEGMPATVELKVVASSSTTANLLLSGEVNLAQVSQADRSRVDAAGLPHADFRAPAGEMFFNQASGRPSEDENVRRALAMAVDLTELGQVITGGSGEPSEGMVTVEPKPCEGDTVGAHLPEYDPEAAGQLLEQAGWAMGEDGVRAKNGVPLSLTLLHATTPETFASAAELAVSQWREAGIQVEAVAKPDTQVSDVLFGTGEWDISWVYLTVLLPSQVVPFVSGAAPPDGTNFGHVDNSDYTRLATQAASALGDSGCADWLAAEEALVQALDVLPYYDQLMPVYASDVEFVLTAGGIVPTSLRLPSG